VPAEFIEGITFGMTLAAQSGHEFTVAAIPDVDPGLSLALHDGRAVTIGFVTATGPGTWSSTSGRSHRRSLTAIVCRLVHSGGMSVQRFVQKDSRIKGAVAARYEFGNPLDDLLSVAYRLDADASMVESPAWRVLLVRHKVWPDSGQAYDDYEVVPDGEWLAFAEDIDVLYILNQAEFDLTCDTFSRLARPQLADLRIHSPHGVIPCTIRGRKVA